MGVMGFDNEGFYRDGVKAKNIGDVSYIVDNENKMWMQICTQDDVVQLKIFPLNIPTAYIGEEAQENEELKYNIFCANKADALRCNRFLSDFINVGYGERMQINKTAWIVGLDLADINKFLSIGDMYYNGFRFNSLKDSKDTIKLFEKYKRIKPKSVLICIYQPSCIESIHKYDSMIEEFYTILPEDCEVLHQCVLDDTIKYGAVIHIIHNQ